MFTRDDIKRKALKERDAWWTVLIIDPIVIRVLPLLANRTRLTPNQVTAISFLCGMVAVGLFLAHTSQALIAGAIFAELWFFFDCIDGKLARLYNVSSKVGMIFDEANELIFTSLSTFALGYGQWVVTHDSWYLLLSYGYVTCNLLYKLVGSWYMKTGIKSVKNKALVTPREDICNHSVVGRLERYPGAVEAGTIVTFIGPLIGQVKLAFIIGTLLLLFRLLGAFVLFFVRLRRSEL